MVKIMTKWHFHALFSGSCAQYEQRHEAAFLETPGDAK